MSLVQGSPVHTQVDIKSLGVAVDNTGIKGKCVVVACQQDPVIISSRGCLGAWTVMSITLVMEMSLMIWHKYSSSRVRESIAYMSKLYAAIDRYSSNLEGKPLK